MRRSKADAEITRCRILEAAADQFAKQGINRTRLSDVASAAGVTRGAIYWHFTDKEALITAMIDSVSAPTEAAMANLNNVAGGGDISLEMLKKVIVDAFTRVYNTPAAAQITRFLLRYALCEETEFLKARINNDRNIALDRISHFIGNAQQAGLIKKELSATCIAIHIRAHISGLFHHHLSTPVPGLKPEDVAASMDLLLNGLRQ